LRNTSTRAGLDRYRAGAPITFELGEADHHIPTHNAQAFVGELQQADPASGARIRVQTYPQLDHLGVTTNDAALTAAADWLITDEPSTRR